MQTNRQATGLDKPEPYIAITYQAAGCGFRNRNPAVQAAIDVTRPGVRAHVLDDAARSVITDAGYGEYFMHRLGHGMGVEVHEPPYLSASSQSVLDEGVVFSTEPGIYLPGRFGLRLEDIVILRADGPELLFELPRTTQVIV